MPRPVNQATVNLVRQFEGLRLRAYLCPAGKPTIGYGHASGVIFGDVITDDEAEEMLGRDLEEAAEHVDRLIRVDLNDNQRGALVSWTFNLGPGNLMTSTLRDVLNRGQYDAVPTQLRRWTKARHPLTGDLVVLPGLVRRREAEAQLWSALG